MKWKRSPISWLTQTQFAPIIPSLELLYIIIYIYRTNNQNIWNSQIQDLWTFLWKGYPLDSLYYEDR